jgi:hypothetical protein
MLKAIAVDILDGAKVDLICVKKGTSLVIQWNGGMHADVALEFVKYGRSVFLWAENLQIGLPHFRRIWPDWYTMLPIVAGMDQIE